MTPSLLDLSPVVPVVVIDDATVAAPLAAALLAGGIPLVEVALRTEAAFAAIRTIRAEVPGMTVGAGTVCTPAQAKLAAEADAQFLVSPGATDRLLDTLQGGELPFVAGVSSTSDMLRLLERGITEAHLFPASVVGGPALLRAVRGPLPQLRFWASGGIALSTAREYLSLPNVACVGGTWLTPRSLVRAADWDAISRLAAEAVALR